ncbi:MAG TPA: hypothetical protein VGT05_01465 [Patescibacteria group bacterium]|nr:hypothetical protein [Patescibacteria group bacterium]
MRIFSITQKNMQAKHFVYEIYYNVITFHMDKTLLEKLGTWFSSQQKIKEIKQISNDQIM